MSAILVRGNRPTWRRRLSRDGGAPPDLASLLARAPIRRGTRVGISVGIWQSQVKRIDGLPPAARDDVWSRVIRENATAFFLRMPPRLVTTRPAALGGGVWCAALDASLVDGLVADLRARGFRPDVVAPEPVVVAAIMPAGSHLVRDGARACEFTTADRSRFTDVRVWAVTGDADAATQPTPERLPGPLALLPDGGDYLAAFAAARCSPGRALSWRPPADPRLRRRAWRAATIAVAAALIVSLSAAVIAPGLRARRDAAVASRIVASHRAASAQAARLDAELRAVTSRLDRIERFQASRGRLPVLFGEIAAALPDSTALLSLRVDSVDANLSVLTPHAADVLPALAGVRGVVSPRIVGSVMRDAASRSNLERAALRFGRPQSAKQSGHPHTRGPIAAGAP